jgi:hypothetical protein
MTWTTGWIRQGTLAMAGLLALGAAGAAHAELVIDSFMTSQKAAVLARGSLGYAESVVTAPEVLGGERDVQVSRQMGAGSASLVINAVGEQLLSCSSSSTAYVACTVNWDGMDGVFALDPTGLGGVDLTGGGANVAFQVPISTALPATLQMQVTSASDGSLAEASIALPGGDLAMVPRFLPFADFSGATDAFADAGSVVLTLTGPPGLDGQIGTITAPEPAHTVLTALGVFSWLALRRRAALSRS